MLAQTLAAALVLRFNALKPPKLVQMLTPMLYEFPHRSDDERRYMAAELCLRDQGVWTRYSDNQSFQRPFFSSMMALSHWSWHYTRGAYMLVDLQGVGYVLSDPQIHSRDRDSLPLLGYGPDSPVNQFGQGDLGEAGINAFFEQHVCNDVCREFELRPHSRQPTWQPPEEQNPEPTTRVGVAFVSTIVGRCGHFFELGARSRGQFFNENQSALCPACIRAARPGWQAFFL